MGGLRLCHCWRGQKRLHTWKPQLLFAYSLYTLYWATMTIIKGRLHVIAMVKKLKFFWITLYNVHFKKVLKML